MTTTLPKRSKWTKAALRELRIFNPWQVSAKGKGRTCIYYHGGDSWEGKNWYVWDKDDKKRFSAWPPRQMKRVALEKALAWAAEKYGVAEWEKDPWGAYHPKGTLPLRRERP